MALKKLKTRKGILLTLVTIVLLILMISELLMYVTLNIGYDTLASQSQTLSSTGYFIQMVRSSSSTYLQSALEGALNALAIYEGTPTLRHYHFVNNTAGALSSLVYNGIIYGTDMSSSMNGTMQKFASMMKQEAQSEYMNFNMTNASVKVYQSGPFALSALYTALAIVNTSYGFFIYPINATASISLIGKPDLYSVEAADPETIRAASALPKAVLVGNMYATSANTLSNAFDYGTVVIINGPTCSNVPPQFQNPYFILAMPNANDINSNLCNMGGLITSVLNSTPPAKPYLVYPQTIFTYLNNGTKLLINGPSKSLLNLTPIKTAMQSNYYYPSPYAPSYLDWANSTFKRSQNGIVSFNILHRFVSQTNGGAGSYGYIANPTFNYSETLWFFIPSYSTSTWYPLTDIYNASVNGGNGGSQNYDYGGLWVNGGKICLLMENWPNSVQLNVCSPYTVVPNTWYFVAISGNWLDETLYVNGTAVSSGSMSSSAIAQAQSTFTKPAISFYTNPPGGLEEAEAGTKLANVQLYSTALSATQIHTIYLEGVNGIPLNLPYLLGWWPLNGNLKDYSGNNYNQVIATGGSVGFVGPYNYSGDSLLWGTYYSSPKQVEGINCMNATQCGNLPQQSLYIGNITLWSNMTTVKNESTALGLQNAIR
ncbi:MAG: LamG-like jellyroll fold domain-containing protein [Candidatus Micrarchaeia archaeon]